ncbi:MAG: YybH family protein [Steroidobacteraceae bacterium]
MSSTSETESQVRDVLEGWAAATRQNRKDDILKNLTANLVIFDVLPPMQYESVAAYRAGWGGDWQPDTQREGQFGLENLVIAFGSDLASAHCCIRCGGTLPDGRSFQDVVRATFCLRKDDGHWKVFHQHVSKPFQMAGK